GLCNCTDCQMLTGSAFRVVVLASSTGFSLLSGRPTTYVKTADSGARRRHAFCPVCGTPVYACAETDDPQSFSLRIGCLRERAQLPPRRQIWCKSALPWTRSIVEIPGTEGQ